MAHTPLAMGFEIPNISAEAGLTSQEQVYVRLRQAILLGAIPTGTALTIRGLAEQLGLSPTPIREAVRRLTSEGAILALDNRRMVVPKMEAARFEELIATRIALECHAAERALPHLSDMGVAAMREVDDAMDRALEQSDYDALVELNHAFHRRLYGANPQPTALPLIESLWLQLGPFQREVITELATFYPVDRHKEILGAAELRDGRALRQAIADDIEDGVAAAGRAALGRRGAH